MVKQDEGLSNDASEKSDRSINAVSSELEVVEATHLEGFELCIICSEESIKRLREDVNHACQALSSPVEGSHLLEDEFAVTQVWHDFRCKQFREKYGVVEGDRHATAGEGMSHIHCVAENEKAWSFICCRR